MSKYPAESPYRNKLRRACRSDISGYLGRGARSHPAVSVQEERGDGAGVAVERVDRGAGVRAEHAHRVVRRARDQPRVVQPHAADGLAVRAARHRPGKRDLGQDF